MSTELTDAEAQKLFNQIAAAGTDPEKLDKAMTAPEASDDVDKGGDLEKTDDTTVVIEDDKSGETPDDDTQKDDVTVDVDKTKEDDETPPPDKAEDTSKDNKNKDQAPDDLAKLREQLDKLTKENHSLRSQAGRVPHVQRKLKEIDKKLEELNQKSASPSNHPSATIQPKVLEKLKGIRETDPELADAIAAALQEASTGLADDALNREKQTLTLLREQELEAFEEEQAQMLLKLVPNAGEVVNSASWIEWKKEQSEDVLRLATSSYADSVLLAMDKYARDMKAKYPDLNKTTDAAQKSEDTVKTVADAEAAKKAAQIEEERRRKQATAASVSSPNASGKVSLPDDPEALFKKYSEEIRKQRTG